MDAHIKKCPGLQSQDFENDDGSSLLETPPATPGTLTGAALLKPATADMKHEMTETIVDCFAAGLMPFRKVDGKYFIKMIQCSIDLGAQHGRIDARDLLPHSSTVLRSVKARADGLRSDMLPELTEAIQMGLASATTDGWTCEVKSQHYITVTFHYIHDSGEKWNLKFKVLYTCEFEMDSESSANLNEELKTQCAARGINPELLEKVHFVTDGASNLVGSLENYSRSYCFDHCLNISLQTAFNVHLIRVDLYGDEGGKVVDAVRKAVGFLRASKLKEHKWCKELARSPTTRLGQKQFNSCIPVLKSAFNNYARIQDALRKSAPSKMFKFSKKTLSDLIGLIQTVQKKAQDRKNTFVGADWQWVLKQTESKAGDSEFLSTLKTHVRRELSVLEALELITKLKRLVAFFKRSGLNNQLDKTLKQEVETRWNSIFNMLQSFFTVPGQIKKVNELLAKNDKADLFVTEAEETKMTSLIDLLSKFKEESLKCEAQKAPTIQFPFLSYRRLSAECFPKPTDSMMLGRLKERISSELKSHYKPHSRHLMGLFLWPPFHKLDLLSEEERKSVHQDVRTMCEQFKSLAPEAQLPGPRQREIPASLAAYLPFRNPTVIKDELDLYLGESPLDTEHVEAKDTLEWWRDRKERYPVLSMVARVIFATPASSAPSERVFSIAGRVADKRRAGLNPDTVDDLLFIFYCLLDDSD